MKRNWMYRRLLPSVVLGFWLSCAGCQSEVGPISGGNKEPKVPEAPALADSRGEMQTDVPRVGPFVLETDGLAFDVPEGWRELQLDPNSLQFISAKLEIPGKAGSEPLTVSFSTVGGGISANVQRWQGEFAGASPRIDRRPVNGREATFVDIRGRFRAAVGTGPDAQENWRMLGVAIPHQPRDFYIKLTGPRAQVASIETAFQQLVDSCRPAN